MMSPAPRTNHQIVSAEIEFILQKFVKENKLGKVFDAPTDVFLDKENCVQPDLLFIAKERTSIITEKNIQGAPDLIIEIVSSTSIHRDTVEKKQLYARFGVKEFWLVYPDEEIIEIYVSKNNTFVLHQSFFKEDILQSALLKGFKINVNEIFYTS